jgi:hypothetical protein
MDGFASSDSIATGSACETSGRPEETMVFNRAGNPYGTAIIGDNIGGLPAARECVVVFKLTPGALGKWTYRVLHKFNNARRAFFPVASLPIKPGTYTALLSAVESTI